MLCCHYQLQSPGLLKQCPLTVLQLYGGTEEQRVPGVAPQPAVGWAPNQVGTPQVMMVSRLLTRFAARVAEHTCLAYFSSLVAASFAAWHA